MPITKNNKHSKLIARSLSTVMVCASFFFVSTVNADKTYSLLPLGDSITHAEINRASYRYFLWKKLIDAGVKFDFVGSMDTQLDTYSKGTPPQPDYQGQSFDKDHEGHFAWEINHLVLGRNPNNNTGSGKLSDWMQNYDFDIALVHIGTNDAFYRQSNEQIAKELIDLISTLRTDNSSAVILLAKVIPTSRSEADAQAVANMAQMLTDLAKEIDTDESPVILVDMFKGFDASKLTYDGVHPNESGEKEMAQRWFTAIMQALPLIKQTVN